MVAKEPQWGQKSVTVGNKCLCKWKWNQTYPLTFEINWWFYINNKFWWLITIERLLEILFVLFCLNRKCKKSNNVRLTFLTFIGFLPVFLLLFYFCCTNQSIFILLLCKIYLNIFCSFVLFRKNACFCLILIIYGKTENLSFVTAILF